MILFCVFTNHIKGLPNELLLDCFQTHVQLALLQMLPSFFSEVKSDLSCTPEWFVPSASEIANAPSAFDSQTHLEVERLIMTIISKSQQLGEPNLENCINTKSSLFVIVVFALLQMKA